MRRWLDPSRIPIAIGAALLLIPWFYLSWNTTMGELAPGLRFRTKQTIAGAVQEAAPSLSLHAVLTGKYQQSISRTIGELSPLFKPAIHWKNQLYYTLLRTGGSDRVVVGRHLALLEKTYLKEYCARDATAFRPEADRWAARLRGVQDFYRSRGKAFLYIITPSKVAQNPQFIPAGYSCPADAVSRASKLVVYDDLLTRHGVLFVDGASTLAAARERYGIDMFPRGGIHWNALAAALAVQRVVAAVNAQHASPPLTPFSFDWRISYTPEGSDRDLLDMMNLPDPDSHYPVPVLTYASSPPPGGCRTAKITEVGGSFMMGMNTIFEQQACPPDFTYWFYWDHNRFRYVGERLKELPMDAGLRTQSLLNADVVFLEENEAVLPSSEHARRMVDELDAIKAGGRGQ